MRSDNGAKFYIRGGYQEIDIDLSKLVDVTLPPETFDGIDDTGGDYMVGVGADLPVGRSAVRFNIDTVSFETLRATVGFAYGF